MNAPAASAAMTPEATADGRPVTLIAALVRNAHDHGDAIAVRERKLGLWRERSWRELHGEVLALAAGLEALGVGADAAVTVIGDNRASLYAAMLAANVLRAFPSPVFADVPPNELALYTRHGAPTVAFAEDQEQVDKLLDLRAAVGRPRLIVYDDPRGLAQSAADGLVAYTALVEQGHARLAATPGLAADLEGRSRPDDIAILLHSSGTTGTPKGIAVRQRNAVAAAWSGGRAGAFATGEETFAYLPIAWVGDYLLSVAAALVLRFTVNIPERQETALHDLRAVAPTLYLAAPRAWDAMLTRVQVGVADSTHFKRALFNLFMPRAIAMERKRLAGETPSASDLIMRRLGEVVIFGPLKDYLGLSRAQHAFTGGEALGEDTFLFFRALGIKLTQLYGQTETCAMTAIQFADDVRLDTVGRPLPGVEIKLGEDGEILARSQSTVDGYFDDAAATAKAFTADGWLRTGDAGAIEPDGHLVVYGRVSEVVHTAAGDRYIPNYIENRLKFSPHIRNVAVLGAGKPWLAAIVCIDREAVGHWAEQRGLAYGSYAELAQRPEVCRLVGDSLAEINRHLPEPLRIRRFVNLHKDFDADDGEITRTRKLRRTVVEERYGPLIETLYAGAGHADVEITITYENGTTGVFARRLALADVGDAPLPKEKR